MLAINCEWLGDLSLGPTGDLLASSAPEASAQRVIRRLLTNPGDYPWHFDFGAGIGSYVGDAISAAKVDAVIFDQLRFEPSVDLSRPPRAVLSLDMGTTSLIVHYQTRGQAATNSISLDLSN